MRQPNGQRNNYSRRHSDHDLIFLVLSHQSSLVLRRGPNHATGPFDPAGARTSVAPRSDRVQMKTGV